MMDQLIERFPAQLVEAMEIGENATILPYDQEINLVYVAGLGGSGIGGDFVAELIKDECKVPYLVGKSYQVPAYLNENTLAIISSYSGNTEETLEALKGIEASGAKVVIISGGGKLIAIAKEKGYDHIIVPGDWPSPRACLGFSFVQQLYVMNKLGFINDRFKKELKASIDLMKFDVDSIKEEARKIAKHMFGTIPILYTTDRMESVAVRLRQQINENAKMLCWHNVIPEMNHNELVGWKDQNKRLSVLFLRNKDDYTRNSIRMDINSKIIGNLCDTVVETYSKGQSLIEKNMYFVHLGDWISWFLSDMRGVDSIEVDVIDYIKGELDQVN